MQRLPTQTLARNAAPAAAKVNTHSPVVVNNKVGAVVNKDAKNAKVSTEAQGQVSSAANGEAQEPKESKGAFAELFSSLLGNSEAKVEGKEGKSEGKNAKGEVAAEGQTKAVPSEVKLDALLKTKDQEKNQKIDVGALSTEKALSPEVLKNINNLLDKSPLPQTKADNASGKVVEEKIAATSSNLEQLLKTLKGDNAETAIEGEEVNPAVLKENQKAKAGSPLDFLLKETKSSDVGAADSKELKLLQSNPETVSKLGLSSEDFMSHKIEGKESKEGKELKLVSSNDKAMNLDSDFDLKAFGQKQMNQSMKAYGQKQNLLSNDGVIRNTKDLAFKDSKSKASVDELKTPDMKIGADLSLVKEAFIPVMQKQEMSQGATTQGSEKVLDLSKINTSNTTEIIKRISDYVQQNQVANTNSMDLTVKHDSLGQFNIQVNKPMGQGKQIDMQITTSTAEGHDFFVKNEIGLMKNLSQAGIQLSDLRIVSGGDSSSFSGMDSRQQHSNSQNNSQTGREFAGFDTTGDSSQGSDRRKELWQEARNNQLRYGA